jgi:hypothetical protein
MSYKILALDGGANWSLLQAMALDALYPGVPGRQILERFDCRSSPSRYEHFLMRKYSPRSELDALMGTGRSRLSRR